jgi:hypothetical protein
MKFVILISVLIIIAGFGCRENAVNTDGDSRPEFLAAEDVGVTDVWLRIKLPFSRIQQPVTLKRDSTTIFRSTITAQDTLVTDERLLPNHTYTYTLLSYIGSMSAPEAHITITTMDTTSHNFTWQTYILSNAGGHIGDVAFINDINIWSVGEMYLRDSSGQIEDFPYGAAHWDGSSWKRIKLPTFCINRTVYLTPTGIIAFGSNDMWLACGGVCKFDGERITKSYWINKFPGNDNFILDDGQYVRKIWGTSDSNLYAVTTGGGIAHFDGSSWQKLNSGTSLDFHDIWGEKNVITGEIQIIAIASQAYDFPLKTEIFTLNGTTVRKIQTVGDGYTTCWFIPSKKYYLGGNGMAWKRSLTDTVWNKFPLGEPTRCYLGRIRGNGLNDILTVGSFMEITHFNGDTWHNYFEEVPYSDAALGSLFIRDNTVIAGGSIGQEALMLIGKRTIIK